MPPSSPASATTRLSLSVGVGFANVMPPAFAGAMAVQVMGDLDVSHAAFGAAVSAFFALNAMSSPIVGGVVDRIGIRNGVRVSAGITAACMISIALLARDYWVLFAILLLGGMGTAFGGPTGSLLLANGFTARRQPFAFGLKQASIPAASAFAGFLVPTVALTTGWRPVFLVGGLIALSVSVAAGLLPRSPSPRARPPRGELASRGRLWVLAGAFFLASSSAMALNSFVVDHAVATGASEAFGGIVLGLGSVAAITVRLLAGWRAGASRRPPLALGAVLVAIGAIGFGILALGGRSGVLPGTVLALGGGWGWTGLLTYAVTVTYPAAPAAATGVIQTGGASGGIVGPTLAGWLVGATSYAMVWTVAATACCIGAALLVWATSTAHRSTSADGSRQVGHHLSR